MSNITKLRDMGYQVNLVSEGYTDLATGEDISATWLVEGFGLSVYVPESDSDTWDNLANEKAHRSRAAQFENPDISEAERIKLDLDARVDIGDIKQKDADKILSDIGNE